VKRKQNIVYFRKYETLQSRALDYSLFKKKKDQPLNRKYYLKEIIFQTTPKTSAYSVNNNQNNNDHNNDHNNTLKTTLPYKTMPSSTRFASSSSLLTSSSSSTSSSSWRRYFSASLTILVVILSASSSSASPYVNRRQTVTDGAESCGVQGPDVINFDKSKGEQTFELVKTGSCDVNVIDLYQIVSYTPEDYKLFSYERLADGVSVRVTIHLAWPKPSAAASDKIQYLVYKGYASEQEKADNNPMVQKFVKIVVVERQPDTNVENYRDPLSSYLVTPPTPISFLDEESAMANASCVNDHFQFTVKAAARLEGVNPKLSVSTITVYQQNEDGDWSNEVSWTDGGEFGDDWSMITRDTSASVSTASTESRAELTVDVMNPLLNSYFVFMILVEDELNWYRHGTAYYIAKWIKKDCDHSKSDFDSIWSEIDIQTPPPTTTTPATTITPDVIITINEEDNNEINNNNNNNENNNNNNDNNNVDKNESENINSISGNNGINKETTTDAGIVSQSVSLLSFTTTLLSCALCLLWTR